MIVGLSIVIALVGLLFFVVLVQRIKEAEDSVKLKRHRSKAAGVAELLNYAAMVDDGIISCKNGALMAAWIFTGEDNANSTEKDRERVSSIINAALVGLGDGWMIHVDAVRRAAPAYIPSEVSHFPDPVSAAIEDERRAFFESRGTMYEGFFVLTVTWFPPMLVQAKLVEYMFNDDTKPTTQEGRYEKLLEAFSKDIATLESRLSSVFHLDRLRSEARIREDGSTVLYDDFLQYLQLCVTGIRQPMQLPSHPVCLDALIGGQELFGGVIPKIGNKFIQVVSIEGFPPESTPGMLSLLTDFDMEYRWSNRFIFLDSHTAVSHMDQYRKKWRQKQRGIVDHIFHLNQTPDADALSMTLDAEMAIAEVKSGLVGAGYYTSVVVLMDEDRQALEAAGHKLAKAIFNLGFAARVESINTLDAYFGSLPGHGVENVRRPLMSSLNLADLLPSSSIWTGDDFAPCPLYPPNSPPLMYCVTTGYSPFRLNLHIRDLGHTLIFGPTGSGKSTALGMIIAQFQRYNGNIFVFDKGMSMYALTTACGGKHFSIASDDADLQFCPLQFIETTGDRAWAQDWIEIVLALNLKDSVTPGQRNEIAGTLKSMAQTGAKTLTDFVSMVQDTSIREALHPYTLGGPMGKLLDADNDGLRLPTQDTKTDGTFASIVTFEMQDLLNLGERWALPILLYLFRRIENSFRGQPGLIVLDEAWVLLANPTIKEKIREWFKVMRKANVAVIMATQNLSDASNSAIFDVILESSATQIFLPNAHARGEFKELYRKMGLNRQQIEIIASSIPKQDYYLVSDKGCRLFSFAIGPTAMAFVGVSDKDSVAKVKQMQKAFGPEWIHKWAESKHVSLPIASQENPHVQ